MYGTTSFKQFKKLLDSLSEVVCAFDKDGRFVYVNQACSTIWGYQPDELIDQYCFDYIVEIDKPSSYKAWEQFFADKKSFEFENEYYHRDGSKVAMSWTGHWDDQDGLLYASGKDVTQKRSREKEMEMLSFIARETVNGIVIMDAHRHITWVNDAFVRSTGYSIEEVLGQRPAALLCGPGTDFALLQQSLEKLQGGDAISFEMMGYTKWQQPIWADIQLQPLFDKQGSVDKFIAIVHDITEKKNLQSQLDQEVARQQKRITSAVIQAQEKERTQLGRELHDNVNQVLTTVKLFNEIVAENVTDQKELIQKSIFYLQKSIDEIRRISKRLAIPPLSEVGLIELTRELVDSINLTNTIEVAYSLKGMHAVPMSQDLQLAIYRIMQEQLNNIIKHAEASIVTIALACKNNQLHLSIKDNGKGFEPAAKRHGIGITNIKSRAESLNGSFHLESAPGKGCSINVAFPLAIETTLT